MSKLLFICREGNDANIGAYGYFRKFSGLFNSARLVVEMLNNRNIEAAIEIAVDNNDIDRLVTKHKPDFCVIEAYWVVPEKFEILHKLHPNITWIIRIHSEVPFWSMEGIAMDWTMRYLDYDNVMLAPNAIRTVDDVKAVLSTKYDKHFINSKVIYLPNYYPPEKKGSARNKDHKRLHIGCFGAIRPYKNQLIQAIAAIKYAERTDRKLFFHINGNRIEGGASPIIKNLRQLFAQATNGFELVEHAWMPHSDFLDVISGIDIGMQVSFTESFNIVAADIVTMDVPIVVSKEISWVNSLFYADETDSEDIVKKLGLAEKFGRFGSHLNRCKLARFSSDSELIWTDKFGDKINIFPSPFGYGFFDTNRS